MRGWGLSRSLAGVSGRLGCLINRPSIRSERRGRKKIARDWNVRASGVGDVTRFVVDKSYLDRYDVQQAGGQTILEYWIPAGDLEEFNRHIVCPIEVVAEYR